MDFSRTPQLASCLIRPEVAEAAVLMKLDFPVPVGPATKMRKRLIRVFGGDVSLLTSCRSCASSCECTCIRKHVVSLIYVYVRHYLL